MTKSGGIRFLLAGYAGVGGMFALERVLRGEGNAASMAASGDDRHTTRDITAAIAVAAVAPPILRLLPFGRLPKGFAAIGLGMQLAGLATRAASMRSLGSFYSRTLRVEEKQHVVDTGPYRWVRHPGYAGSLLVWGGFALASRSLPAVVLVTGLFSAVYRRRILAEEMLLRRDLPGYVTYSENTDRLVPHVW
ncbi:MAG TPA: isoprenylcysteine carboxylmethyltransferase family protein [Pseudonocardiaceae bacterium]|nr:isoprenylcysteine carboxylmethyltransferase family protein [Pseudonocardiaceae bacterium]